MLYKQFVDFELQLPRSSPDTDSENHSTEAPLIPLQESKSSVQHLMSSPTLSSLPAAEVVLAWADILQ